MGFGGASGLTVYFTIDFTTEGDHKYRILTERRGNRDYIWVEDYTNVFDPADIAIVIAGEKPPDDKGEDKSGSR